MSIVYCMGCEQLLEAELCLGIMRTGFYKINIPLARQCVHCKEDEDKDSKPNTEIVAEE
jgi:hypothetical protein